MKPRFRVFTAENVAIYGVALGLAPLGVFVAVLVSPLPAADATAKAITGLAALAFVSISTTYFALRMRYAERFERDLIGVARQGVAILADVKFDHVDDCRADVEADIEWVADFWAVRTNVAGIAHQGRAAFHALLADGATLTFVPDPIMVETFGQSTEGAPVRLAAGLTKRNHMRVWWPVGVAYQGEPSKRVRHELAHVYLTALGVAPERHHAVMNEHGFPV